MSKCFLCQFKSALPLQTPTAIALGNFDGVHRGHQEVIRTLLEAAPADCCPSVITFSPHPQAFFTGEQRLLLTPEAEKRALLNQYGIEQVIVLPFTQALAQLSPLEFVEQILVQQLQAKVLSVGFNFGFGRGRSGTAEDLRTLCAAFGIAVHIVPPFCWGSDRVSSSAVRAALAAGDVALARELLGRAYTLTGTVTQGEQLGRQLGFPTANLALPPEKLLPRYGVYACRVSGAALPREQVGVVNIGVRPTVRGQEVRTEVHLLHWQGNLYNQEITLHLEAFIRPELRFSSLAALQAQIAADCQVAADLLERVVSYA
ncbi:bifunctional riboflavin kinase / FMN adenylyltransferase RibF [Thermosynechococcus sp. NK55a]|uniref:bifunctional riboflavin kinase/FAD synthetase n=1 Tax=unclassified Thermosynechococcus TaxID=2622553 RepID=UPI0003D8ABF5|nr:MULTISPECIES: bifunctional riboflavin kinase/FAD synthetase [unclassified Thermosynechococcus]AHB88208.1 bifunctional riboflavin kinase / FMN adenylyltransferase RibF [Thermosynechococcus sp. NK55a]RMH67448.1 MAG: bifunctional riboflavin kinase/FAD synthetase [Cyanobacteria bacterium J003]HIK22901.1 bifunctional riboflavin kinase/FAD synthetase [Thermosynechococcus sp. M3746_W2019_013]